MLRMPPPARRGRTRSAHAKSNHGWKRFVQRLLAQHHPVYLKLRCAAFEAEFPLAGRYVVHQDLCIDCWILWVHESCGQGFKGQVRLYFSARVNGEAGLFGSPCFPRLRNPPAAGFVKDCVAALAEVNPLTKLIRGGLGQGRHVLAVIDVEAFQPRQCRRNTGIEWIKGSAGWKQDGLHPAVIRVDDA